MIAAVARSQPAAQTLPPGYVGSETCAGCHEDIAKAFANSPHHQVDVDAKRGWQGRACESCHGPGQKHAESANPALIRNPANLDARGGRQNLSHLSSEPADADRTAREQPRQQPDFVHRLP